MIDEMLGFLGQANIVVDLNYDRGINNTALVWLRAP